MKSLKYRLKKHEVNITNTDWNKYDDRLMKAVERGEVDKVSAVLAKKGIIPTKLDVEGRSAFHLAATRGHLDCLNLILGQNVDITATDATGKNALHLASRNGHSLCVQKLLQHNCPGGNVDLQGRTALHDAVMAGCSSSVKLLCDSGAAVNATDFDGRTPLVLATQMCHPRICQLLLDRGADITIRDKQNKTALILGCEYGCKDAVDVLLKSGADLKPQDAFGHDAFHYARHSKSPELLSLVKAQLDKANREKDAARIEQWKRQHSIERPDPAEINRRDQAIHDLERQNESLQESLRRSHQEQRGLLDQVSQLQQQLTQEKVDECLKEDSSKMPKEDGPRGLETVKVQLKSPMGDYSGQSVIKGKEILLKQAQSLDTEQIPRVSISRSMSRGSEKQQAAVGWDLPAELEALRRELEQVRRRQQASEEETARLQSALNRKNRECQELVQSRDSIQKQADQQIQELEDALGDVQKRMLESECKVKQLQAHVVAVKEHLGGQANEELRLQLQDVKSKYEGASAEVGRVRNRLKQSEKALEEYKSSESQLAAEAERLHHELGAVSAERDELADTLLEMESQLKEVRTKPGNTVPAEKFDNMKNLLTNAVDEKERQIAELREDYDRVLEEVADLHRRMDSPSAQAMSSEEEQKIRAALEEHNASLKQRLLEVTAKSHSLIQEVEESEEELEKLKARIQTDFIPVHLHEQARHNMVQALEELEDKLVEASERYGKAEAQVDQLQLHRSTLEDELQHRQGTREQVDELKVLNATLVKQLETMQRRCEEQDEACVQLRAQSQELKKSLDGEYVPRQQMEQTNKELTATIEDLRSQVSELESRKNERGEELQNVKEGNDKLKGELERVRLEVRKDYVCVSEHNAMTDQLKVAAVEAENRANKTAEMYAAAQDETIRLTQELQAQKQELDTIQEAIQAKFIPRIAMEEKEKTYEKKVKELTDKLTEMEDKYNNETKSRESSEHGEEKLKAQLAEVNKKLDVALVERKKELEKEYSCKFQELTVKVQDLEKQHEEEKRQNAELQKENINYTTQVQSLQERLRSELTRIANYDGELKVLNQEVQQAQADCKKARAALQDEAQKTCVLQKEMQEVQEEVQQTTRTKENLEAKVGKLELALKEEEENNAQRAEDVSALQSELLQATQALEELRRRHEDVTQLQKDKHQQSEEVLGLREKLLLLSEEVQDAREDAALASEQERKAKGEMNALQEKSRAVEKEIGELKERYDQSLSTIQELQKRIQASAHQTDAKDKKITELLIDVERLKQALNGLSQLAYTSSAPKRQTDSLQAQIKSLQQQLADAERQHREVVSIYRTHLLSAAQGHMDEDVQAALLQIIRMRQEFVC
ncbi:uveal autoantigen with coiled-coil domains and ankyrin repeats protein [Eucyclogobius newberryi]|uniref:uveal autoantigen with coiled-coil domains and ankyrin repeats protein n=1 Tax=Eucyclogobius newberryi TaxID=166745 RepID=UPI003B5BEA89